KDVRDGRVEERIEFLQEQTSDDDFFGEAIRHGYDEQRRRQREKPTHGEVAARWEKKARRALRTQRKRGQEGIKQDRENQGEGQPSPEDTGTHVDGAEVPARQPGEQDYRPDAD